jgi:tRNA threonylcarbamoyladenosine biosynthesis protein TsaE
MELKSHNPEQTQLLGSYLGELAQENDLFLLTGDLGSGKTCLVQGIAHGLAITEYAFSPSFVLVREYHGRLPLCHIDLYRLDHVAEISDLGLEECLYNNRVCAVEWAEKGLALWPRNNLLIRLDYVSGSETQRIIRLKPEGQRYSQLVKELELILSRGKAWNWL